MSLTRLFNDPFYFTSEFDRLFDDALTRRVDGNRQVASQRNNSTMMMTPRMDMHEDTKANTITAIFELPGLKKDDVTIEVHDTMLTVSGESKQRSDHDENGYAVRERRYGKFSRAIPLPPGVKSNEIKAMMENGVLTVMFPRTTPEQVAKRISIN